MKCAADYDVLFCADAHLANSDRVRASIEDKLTFDSFPPFPTYLFLLSPGMGRGTANLPTILCHGPGRLGGGQIVGLWCSGHLHIHLRVVHCVSVLRFLLQI